MNEQEFLLELRKRKDNTVLTITEKELLSNPDKILQILSKECVDLKTWFYIIVNPS
jgi:hypothetical protein